MNARLNRHIALLLVLAGLMVAGLARADTPAASVNATPIQPIQTPQLLAWQRVGNPATRDA